MKYKLDLQHFAEDTSVQGSVVKGSRVFIMDTVVPTVADQIMGVRATPDKGSESNKQECTTVDSTSVKQAIGLQGETSGTFTFLLAKETLDQQVDLISGTHWVYEEQEDTSANPSKIGMGTLMKVQFGGLTITGMTPDNLREFSQDFTMVSDSHYLCFPTYTGDTATWVYKDAVSGATVTTPK